MWYQNEKVIIDWYFYWLTQCEIGMWLSSTVLRVMRWKDWRIQLINVHVGCLSATVRTILNFAISSSCTRPASFTSINVPCLTKSYFAYQWVLTDPCSGCEIFLGFLFLLDPLVLKFYVRNIHLVLFKFMSS